LRTIKGQVKELTDAIEKNTKVTIKKRRY
jgi:hypothetical protein